MEYRRVKPDERLLRATAIPDVFEVVACGKYEVCMIAGFENEEPKDNPPMNDSQADITKLPDPDSSEKLVCYAIFSHVPGIERDVHLEYLFTVRERREEGFCTGLLRYCEEYLAKQGVSVIQSRIYITPDFAVEYNSFITNRGYIPLNVTGRMLEYRLSEMLDSGTVQTILKNMKKLPPIMKLDEVGEQRINVLLSEHRNTGFFFVKEECDERYSRFYLEDGEIHGAVIAERPAPDTLYISALYMDRLAEKRNMFLALFSECLEPLLNDEDEENIRVIIMINSEQVYMGLMKVFNPPDDEFLVLEHMKQIR